MPTHCSVPLCIKKGYREKETGEKVSSNFPPKKGWESCGFMLFGEMREKTSRFQILLKKSFNGVVSLGKGAVPSVFAWKRSSPRKRPPPTPRIPSTVSHNLYRNISEVVETASSSEILETSESSSNSHLAPEIEELQSSTNFWFAVRGKSGNYTTRETFSCTTEIKEKLQSEVLSLKGNIASLEQKCEKLEKYVFSFDNVKTDYS